MSTVAVQQPSHSSPLRPRDTDPTLRAPKTSTTVRHSTATTTTDVRRSMSSGASARAAGNNARRSPSGERPARNRNSGSSNGSKSPVDASSSYPSKQPNSSSNPNSSPNVPIIKKEQPSSPENLSHPPSRSTNMSSSRHRPSRLDLTRNMNVPQGASTVGARPSTKDSAGLNVMHDVGLACLSPGFQSQDPSIQAQLQKSMDIREHQRRIIESQMHGKSAGGEKSAAESGPPASAFGKPPGSSRRKGPPPGLAIHAPSASQFAEYRAIQSAPLNQTFTGLHAKQPSSLSRQILDRQGANVDASRITQAPTSQSSNRLPPITDVLPGEGLGSARGPPSAFYAPHSTYSPAHPGASAPMGSPGFPPPLASAGLQPPRSHPGSQSQQPSSREGHGPPRHREFKSAEDAIQTFSGGREDLQPKLVHYGGHQPPTPPSPRNGEGKPPPTSQPQYGPRSGSGRRRTREEYERDLPEAEIDNREHMERRRVGAANEERRYAAWEEDQRERPTVQTGPFGHRVHSPETNRRKREEFMDLCARAWDLLHS